MSVAAAERLSRYLPRKKSVVSLANKRVKYSAFLPNSNGRTSVYRTEALSEDEIWQLAATFVAPEIGDVAARGDVSSEVLPSLGLSLDPDGVPHPRHANIIGWPGAKEAQKVKALVLESAAHFVARP